MIPRIIHYVWVGGASKPELVERCMTSWRQFMPDWEYREWNEQTIAEAMGVGSFSDVLTVWPAYVREALEARKFAFVSDYIRLWALEREGGVYLDTDVEIIRPYDALLVTAIDGQPNTAFIGFEESLAHLPGTCVMGCEAHCTWVKDMINLYDGLHFRNPDGSIDQLTNVARMGRCMVASGLKPNGKQQYLAQWGLSVYDHHYFSPITSTRVMRKSKDTYSIHRFAGSWTGNKKGGVKDWIITREIINVGVMIKRLLLGIK